MEVIWKTLIYRGEEYPRFEVSNCGKLRNAITGTEYKLNIANGYYSVCVSLGSRNDKKLFKAHRAVAETFIPNPENKPTINHKDGNKLNNNVDNLEWATYSENTQHAFDTGLAKSASGENACNSKLTQEQAEWIRANYIPFSKEFGSRALGRKFDMAHTTILDVINNITYINTAE